MTKRLLSDDGNLKEYVHFDPANPDDLIIEEVEYTELLKEAARMIADQDPSSEFRHAAIIPRTVMRQAMREGWANDSAAWKKWANDGNNAYLRTWKGNL